MLTYLRTAKTYTVWYSTISYFVDPFSCSTEPGGSAGVDGDPPPGPAPVCPAVGQQQQQLPRQQQQQLPQQQPGGRVIRPTHPGQHRHWPASCSVVAAIPEQVSFSWFLGSFQLAYQKDLNVDKSLSLLFWASRHTCLVPVSEIFSTSDLDSS